MRYAVENMNTKWLCQFVFALDFWGDVPWVINVSLGMSRHTLKLW